MRIKCDCGLYVSINLYTHEDIANTGKPKQIGDGNCVCGRKAKVYATVQIVK